MQLSEIELWLDMQFSPHLAKHIEDTYQVKTTSSYSLGFNTANDYSIFMMARNARNTIILTKDKDFSELLMRFKSPPKIILLRVPNVSNNVMKQVLHEYLIPSLNELLNTTTELIEIKPKNFT